MRWVWLALLVAVPASGQNIRGTVAPLTGGPPAALAAACGPGPVDADVCYLTWDVSLTERATDATQPCIPQCVLIAVTPTPAAAAAMTYRVRNVGGPNTFLGPRVLSGVTCDTQTCRSLPLGTFLPELRQGGSWSIGLTRERLPQFQESTESAAVMFTTLNAGGPPPPPPPPSCTCPYVTPIGQLTPLSCGQVRSGKNAFPSISRNDQLLSMWMELKLRKVSPTQVQMDATCVGPPPVLPVEPAARPVPRARPVRVRDEV